MKNTIKIVHADELFLTFYQTIRINCQTNLMLKISLHFKNIFACKVSTPKASFWFEFLNL